jgi:NTP pyrophosphatase (non-canonical NTP hydrolase)
MNQSQTLDQPTEEVVEVDITDMPRIDIPAEPEQPAESTEPESESEPTSLPDDVRKAIADVVEAVEAIKNAASGECNCPICQAERDGDLEAQILPIPLAVIVNALRDICTAENARWDKHPVTGEPLEREFGTLIALTHGELSEALEAERKDAQDEHLPEIKGVDVELADAVIRIMHIAGKRNIDIGAALVAKLRYNRTREDHSDEARTAPGGKKY